MTEQKLIQENFDKQERFCSWCGLSLVPLNVDRYISKSCTECGKTIYTLQSSVENGQGLVIREGELIARLSKFASGTIAIKTHWHQYDRHHR